MDITELTSKGKLKPGTKPRPISERFWPKVEKTDSCWNWIGAIDNRTGFGVIKQEGKSSCILAHRVSYELNIGEIPNGMRVLHSCGNRKCVNPAHFYLELRPSEVNKTKTHCPLGHPYSGENLYLRPNSNKRGCKACIKISKEKSKAKQNT